MAAGSDGTRLLMINPALADAVRRTFAWGWPGVWREREAPYNVGHGRGTCGRCPGAIDAWGSAAANTDEAAGGMTEAARVIVDMHKARRQMEGLERSKVGWRKRSNCTEVARKRTKKGSQTTPGVTRKRNSTFICIVQLQHRYVTSLQCALGV